MTGIGRRALENLREMVRDIATGDVIAERFELGELLGEGASGRVFAALDRESRREAAVKFVPVDAWPDVARFEREVEALRRVAHPAVATYVAHGAHGSYRFVVTERLFGRTLARRLAEGPLSVSEALELGRRVASGLSSLHREGIVHRDVKPSNVFLVGGSAEGATLLDMGLSTGTSDPITAKGALVGTVGYMAPEQIRASAPAGPPADVFALGCVLYESLAGRPPFQAPTTDLLLTKMLVEAPDPLAPMRHDAPAALVDLLAETMQKSAEARPSAERVAERLTALAALAATALAGAGDSGTAQAAARSQGPIPIGAVLAGKYRVESRVGEGGMGIVFLARHLELGTRVAIKVLRAATGGDEETRFLREARAAAQLDSDRVVRVLDVGRVNERTPYIVMEYLDGVDLARRLASGPLEVPEAVGAVVEACEAIAAAHQAGIVHRDLKPSNLFLCTKKDGTRALKVLDFGISKITRPLEGDQGTISMTEARSVVGSAGYMSPEQLKSAKQVDPRTDIWSLGVVLYELLCGARPFEGENAAAVGALIATAEPPSLAGRAACVPRELEHVVLRCLEKDPDRRYPNAGELAGALLPFCPSRRASVDRARQLTGVSAATDGRSPATSSRRPALVYALAVAAVTIGAALALAAPRGHSTTEAIARPETPAPTVSAVPRAEPPAATAPEGAGQADSVPPPRVETAPVPSSAAAPTAATSTTSGTTARPRAARPAVRPSASASVSPSNRGNAVLDIRDPALEAR